MKKFSVVVIISVLAVLLSCENKDGLVEEGTTRVKGQIYRYESEELTITQDNPYDYDFDCVTLASTKVDTNGYFSVNFPLKQPDIVQIRTGSELLLDVLYVFPGKETNAILNNLNEEELRAEFKGDAAIFNNYRFDFRNKFVKDTSYYNRLNYGDLETAMEYADKRREKQNKFYEDYFKNVEVPKIVETFEKSRIGYEWANFKIKWALAHYFYRPNEWNKSFPKDYFGFLNEINLVEPHLSEFLADYLEALIWQWHINQKRKGTTPTAQERARAKFNMAKNKFTGATRDIAMATNLYNLLTYDFHPKMTGVIRELLNDFKNEIKNKNYLPPLVKKFEKRMNLTKGNAAPEFILPNVYEAPVALSDFKGKVVYIEFWSSDYPIYKQRVPLMQELVARFRNNENLALVYIGAEKKPFQRWRAFVLDNKMPGYQLYMENQFRNEVARDYLVKSLPAYYIIDKEGKIYKSDFLLMENKELIETLSRLANSNI